MERNPQYLIEKYPDLAGSRPVDAAVNKSIATGEKGPNTKEDRVGRYLARLEAIAKNDTAHTPTGHGELFADAPQEESVEPTKVHPERSAQYLKDLILKDYVLDTLDDATVEAVALGLYKSEKQLAVEQGRSADVEHLEQTRPNDILPLYKNAVIEKAAIQKKTLTEWLDYLHQNDAGYPMWFQYMVVRELKKMGALDKEHLTYSRRTSKTVAPFPELNSEALGWAYSRIRDDVPADLYVPRSEEAALRRDALVKAIDKKDFASLYAIGQVETAGKINKESIEGEWREYKKGSDPHILENDLKGKGTGWCTAEGSAEAHLNAGDFYVYYTKTQSGYTQPRVAIRMENDTVAEVRGVDTRQALEPELVDIARNKFKDLPGGDTYEKKSNDMKRLTGISKLYDMETRAWKRLLTKKELTFLYEIDAKIEGFGYDDDPRVTELRSQRDPKADAPIVFECQPNEIAWSQTEITKTTKAYVGPLFPGIFKQIGRLEHLYTSFPEGKIRQQAIDIDNRTPQQLLEDLQKQGFQVSDYAKYMVEHMRDYGEKAVPAAIINKVTSIFGKKKEDIQSERIETVRLTPRDLGFNQGATIDDIYKKGKEFGLELCPPEVGPQYRLQYTNQPMGEWFFIAMKQISDPDGGPSVFNLRHGDDGVWLYYHWAEPDDRWNPDNQFVFRLRK